METSFERSEDKLKSLMDMLDDVDVIDLDREEENTAAWLKTRDEWMKANELIPEDINQKVESIVKKEFEAVGKKLGMCHLIWHRKKELFKEFGYDWRSPQELNPFIYFD